MKDWKDYIFIILFICCSKLETINLCYGRGQSTGYFQGKEKVFWVLEIFYILIWIMVPGVLYAKILQDIEVCHMHFTVYKLILNNEERENENEK